MEYRYRVVGGFVRKNDNESAVAKPSRVLRVCPNAVLQHPVLLGLSEIAALGSEDVVARTKYYVRLNSQRSFTHDPPLGRPTGSYQNQIEMW